MSSNRALKRIFKILYGNSFNSVLTLGLGLIWLEGVKFLFGENEQVDNAQNYHRFIYVSLAVAFIGAFANTCFMLENHEEIENSGLLDLMSKREIAKAVAIAVPTTLIALAGASEFIDTQTSPGSDYRKLLWGFYGPLTLLAAPGEFFTYGKGFSETGKLAIATVYKFFKHPELTGYKKIQYSGLLTAQTLSVFSDNLIEIVAIKELLKVFLLAIGFQNNPLAGLIIGIVVAAAYASFEWNNEINAIFSVALEKLDPVNNDLEVNNNAESQEKHSRAVKILSTLLTAINCLCYMSASSLLAPFIGYFTNAIPFTEKSHPDTYLYWNAFFLALPMLTIGPFSAYGQYKTVSAHTTATVQKICDNFSYAGLMQTLGMFKCENKPDETTRLLEAAADNKPILVVN